jgi:hypothetical protein
MSLSEETAAAFSCSLCGACVTIQTAWRAYSSRQRFRLFKTYCSFFKDYTAETSDDDDDDDNNVCDNNSDLQEDTPRPCLSTQQSYLNTALLNLLQNNFRCDVDILVQGQAYPCHSYVLWCNSECFKEILEDKYASILTSPENNNITDPFQLKYELLASAKCWETLRSYMYGYSVTLDDDIVDELVYLANELRVEDLVFELEHTLILKESCLSLNEKSESVESEQVVHVSCESESETGSTSMTIMSATETSSNVESPPPFQLVTNYFNFFKCVIDLFTQRKLDKTKALGYLSDPACVDYTQMSSDQLQTCLLLLKTKMKLKDSDLITRIVGIYWNKRSLTQLSTNISS